MIAAVVFGEHRRTRSIVVFTVCSSRAIALSITRDYIHFFFLFLDHCNRYIIFVHTNISIPVAAVYMRRKKMPSLKQNNYE